MWPFACFVLGGFAPSVSAADFPWYAVFLSALALTGGYLWKLIWPVHLSAFYVFHPSRHWAIPESWPGLLVC